MSVNTVGKRKLRTLNIMDDYSREALAIEFDKSLPSKRVIRTLDRIIELQGKLVTIRTDNGAEFTSKDLELYIIDIGITLHFIQPRKTMQNDFTGRFNRLYHEAILDAYLFFDLKEVGVLIKEWIEEYNDHRPHKSLNKQTPTEWKINLTKNEYFLNKTV